MHTEGTHNHNDTHGGPIWSSQSPDLFTDRGLFYGDGLFETVLVSAGIPQLLSRHLARLARSARAFGIELPATLNAEIARGLRETGLTEAVLKLLLTRRASSRGYAPDNSAGSNAYVLLYPRGAAAQSGQSGARVTIGLCATRLAEQPRLAGHKHLNRLEQVLARAEWRRADVHEGMMLTADDQLIEGTASNVFLLQDGVLRTPALDTCGVAGVMREWVLDKAVELGVPCEVKALSLVDLTAADEVFLTSALAGVVPVTDYVGPFAQLDVNTDLLTPLVSYPVPTLAVALAQALRAEYGRTESAP